MIPEYLDIPIFPLPNLTFFPSTYLPLHVFEERYRKLTRNALAGDRLMGLALLKEGWQNDYFGAPGLHKTMGVGKIVDCDELSDGRFNLILEGLWRVRLVEEYPTREFRTGRVQVLQDRPIDSQRAAVSDRVKEMRSLTGRLGERLPQLRESIQGAWASHPHPLVVVGQLANAVVVDAYDRQSIFEQDDPLRRIDLLCVQLRLILHQLECRSACSEELIEED